VELARAWSGSWGRGSTFGLNSSAVGRPVPVEQAGKQASSWQSTHDRRERARVYYAVLRRSGIGGGSSGVGAVHAKPAGQHIVGGPVAEMGEGGQEPVDEDRPVLRVGAHGTPPRPAGEPGVLALLPQRADCGDEFGNHIGRQVRDLPIADDHCTSSPGSQDSWSSPGCRRYTPNRHVGWPVGRGQSETSGIYAAPGVLRQDRTRFGPLRCRLQSPYRAAIRAVPRATSPSARAFELFTRARTLGRAGATDGCWGNAPESASIRSPGGPTAA
jgi:hypothetical protein